MGEMGVGEMGVGEMAVGEMLWVWVRWWILTIRWRMVGGGWWRRWKSSFN